MTALRLGAFGWATHEPKSSNESRESKLRPCVVVLQSGKFFAVVFGRSEPFLNFPRVTISEQSDVGRRLGLRVPTHFQGEIALVPKDFECKGFFAIDPEDVHSPDAVKNDELWLQLRTLASRKS